MKWRVTGASARGSAHLRMGIPNQDACEFRNGDRSSALRAVLAVSDGHGGARHFRSQVGSSLAVHIAINTLYDGLENWLAETGAGIQNNPIEDAAPTLAKDLAGAWRVAVLSDFRHNAFSPEELTAVEAAEGPLARTSVEEDPVVAYGATLLAAAVTDEFILYLQLGDGDILSVDENGETGRPIAPDDRLIANQTTSLCMADAPQQFHFAIARAFPALVLLATDGYSNSFRSDADFLKIGGDYLDILRKQGIDHLAEELPAILAGASLEGSGDDITLGILHRPVSSTSTFPVPATLAEPAANAAAAAPTRPGPPKPTNAKRNTKGLWIAGGCVLGLALSLFAYLVWLRLCCAAPPTGERPPVTSTPRQKPPGEASRKQSIPPSSSSGPESTTILPKGKVFALNLSAAGGPVIELQPGDQILFNALQVQAAPSSEPYAEVRRDPQGGWVLVNLGSDTWTVQKAGKHFVEPPVGNAEFVTLEAKLQITFRNATAATVQIITPARPAAGH